MDYITYYRVSTQKQGQSGLGLQAQKEAVKKHLNGKPILFEFTDIESGTKKGNDRPNLKQAIELSRKTGSTLVIAKLDRLARNVRFITSLMESGVEFIACDMPQANKFTIHIFSALAEQEAEMISIRTKQALAELKKNGIKLGKPENLSKEAIERGRIKRINNSSLDDNNRKAGALIVSMVDQGKSLYNISKELNRLGFKTRRDCDFTIMQVKRLYNKYTANTHQATNAKIYHLINV